MIKQREEIYSSQSPCVSCEKDGSCDDADCELFVKWLKEKWFPHDEKREMKSESVLPDA